MLRRTRAGFAAVTSALLLALWAVGLPPVARPATEAKSGEKLAPPVTEGQRVFTCGHSFHYFAPPILSDLAKKADIKDHQVVGVSSIGGSRVIQHWNVPEEKNKAR